MDEIKKTEEGGGRSKRRPRESEVKKMKVMGCSTQWPQYISVIWEAVTC